MITFQGASLGKRLLCLRGYKRIGLDCLARLPYSSLLYTVKIYK